MGAWETGSPESHRKLLFFVIMGITKVNELKVGEARAKLVSNLPTTPQGYYGTGVGDVDSVEWRGGGVF